MTAKTYFAPANEGQEIKAVSEQLEKEREEKKTDKAKQSPIKKSGILAKMT